MKANNFFITTSGLVVRFFTFKGVLFNVALACHSECECESNGSLQGRRTDGTHTNTHQQNLF